MAFYMTHYSSSVASGSVQVRGGRSLSGGQGGRCVLSLNIVAPSSLPLSFVAALLEGSVEHKSTAQSPAFFIYGRETSDSDPWFLAVKPILGPASTPEAASIFTKAICSCLNLFCRWL